jgi:hypothetical protein
MHGGADPMLDNQVKSTDRSYRSPVRKLIRFFEESRNQWKVKCLSAKHQIKLLSNKTRYLEKRKADLTNKVKELEKKLDDLQGKQTVIMPPGGGKFDIIPSFHSYSIAHICLFVEFVLSGGASLRGASGILGIITSFMNLGGSTPSWYTGRFWLLRLGYYKLERAKQKAADWIWIVDHTVQLGSEKCLVIVGIRQSSLPAVDLRLSHEDVEPIALLPVSKSNGAVVHEQLVQTVEKTGVPRQIVGDYGPADPVNSLSNGHYFWTVRRTVFSSYEADTWYDRGGRIVFTASKGLPGVGFSRPEWGPIKAMQSGSVSRTIMDDTLPGGPRERTIVYQAPFDHCDRERDYEIAWAEFERRFQQVRLS